MEIFGVGGLGTKLKVKGYFDFNATAPAFPAAVEEMNRCLAGEWYNPSGLYHAGGRVRRHLEEAREVLAERLGVGEPSRLVFTSGATESNNHVMHHVAAEAGENALWVSEIEHPSLLEPAGRSWGSEPVRLRTDANGMVCLEDFRARLERERPALVSVMAANNETGVLQPWREIRDLCRERGIAFHCDAAQWIGKLNARDFGLCDWLTGSAHKFGGLKGTGFLVVPAGTVRLYGGLCGGPQERGLRAGTENFPGVAAMLTALEQAANLAGERGALASRRDQFERAVAAEIPGLKICGAGAPRLWNTTMMVMPAHRNLKWLTRLSHLGFSLSTGSACSSGAGHSSHVLEAMGIEAGERDRALRISGGWQTSEADWRDLARALQEVYADLNSSDHAKRRRRSIRLDKPNPFPTGTGPGT